MITSDVFGNVIEAIQYDTLGSDVGGVGSERRTRFNYDLQGRLIDVQDPENAFFAYTYDVFGNRLTSDDPGLGYWTMQYDEHGNLTQQTDAKGQTLTFTYDGLDRVKTKVVSGGSNGTQSYSYGYDTVWGQPNYIGKLSDVSHNQTGNSISYKYTNLGNVREVKTKISGQTLQTNTYFNANGSVDKHSISRFLSTGSGFNWLYEFTYDAAGRVTRYGDWGTKPVDYITYNHWGQPTRTDYGNNTYDLIAYDAERGWVDKIETYDGANTLIQMSDYTRDASGRIVSVDAEQTEARFDYTYDYAGRLLSAVNSDGFSQYDRSYTYDAAGRMRDNSGLGVYNYSLLTPDHAPASITIGAATVPLTYDANGNMTASFDGRTMSYDGENRPLSVTTGTNQTTAFTYAPDGTRALKVTDQGTAQEVTTYTTGMLEARFSSAGLDALVV